MGAEGEWLLAGDTGDIRVDPERFARFEAIAAGLRRAAAQHPLFLVFDDLHVADAGALLLIRLVARALDRSRIVILLSRRDHAAGSNAPPPDLVSSVESDATVLALAPFDTGETIALLHAALRADADSAAVTALMSCGVLRKLKRISGCAAASGLLRRTDPRLSGRR